MTGSLVMPPRLNIPQREVTWNPPWAALLELFYRRLGLALPPMTRLAPDELPAPYRRLLAHSDDMTPTLEKFYGGRLDLTVLTRECTAINYRREVVLKLERNRRPVEYGAIGIHLQHLPPSARRLVLEERHPFGRMLETEAIAHLSWPQAFFSVRSDAHMSRLLGAANPTTLYGRRNVIVDGHRRLLADVVEIVAPVPEPRPAVRELRGGDRLSPPPPVEGRNVRSGAARLSR